MSKLEKAARNYIDKYYADDEYPSEIKDIVTDSEQSFIAGALWQKENMLISVEEALPPNENTKVICMMKSNGEFVSGYINLENGVPIVYTDSDFEFEDYGNYEVTHWMSIPKHDVNV